MEIVGAKMADRRITYPIVISKEDNGVDHDVICRSASITEEELEMVLRETSEG